MGRQGMKIHGTVRLVTVQIDGDAGNRDVRGHQRVKHYLPPAGSQQSMSQPIEGGVKKYHVHLSIVARTVLPNFNLLPGAAKDNPQL